MVAIEQDRREGREIERPRDPQRDHQDQHRERDREGEADVDQEGRDRQEQHRQDDDDAEREEDVAAILGHGFGADCLGDRHVASKSHAARASAGAVRLGVQACARVGEGRTSPSASQRLCGKFSLRLDGSRYRRRAGGLALSSRVGRHVARSRRPISAVMLRRSLAACVRVGPSSHACSLRSGSLMRRKRGGKRGTGRRLFSLVRGAVSRAPPAFLPQADGTWRCARLRQGPDLWVRHPDAPPSCDRPGAVLPPHVIRFMTRVPARAMRRIMQGRVKWAKLRGRE